MCAGAPKSSCAADQGQGGEVAGREQGRCGGGGCAVVGCVRRRGDPMIVPARDPLSRFKLPRDRPGLTQRTLCDSMTAAERPAGLSATQSVDERGGGPGGSVALTRDERDRSLPNGKGPVRSAPCSWDPAGRPAGQITDTDSHACNALTGP